MKEIGSYRQMFPVYIILLVDNVLLKEDLLKSYHRLLVAIVRFFILDRFRWITKSLLFSNSGCKS